MNLTDLPMTIEEVEDLLSKSEGDLATRKVPQAPLKSLGMVKLFPPPPRRLKINPVPRKRRLTGLERDRGGKFKKVPKPPPPPPTEPSKLPTEFASLVLPPGVEIPPEATFVQPSAEELAAFIFSNCIVPHLSSSSTSSVHSQCHENVFRKFYLPQLTAFLAASLSRTPLSYKELNSLVDTSLNLLGFK